MRAVMRFVQRHPNVWLVFACEVVRRFSVWRAPPRRPLAEVADATQRTGRFYT